MTFKKGQSGSPNTQFTKGASGNPKGRPPKNYSKINKVLRERGFEPIPRAEFIEVISILFSCDETTLRNLLTDPETPYSITLIVSGLLNKRSGINILADYRDYVFGKSKSSIEVEDKKTNTEADFSMLTTQEKIQLLKLLKKTNWTELPNM